MTDHLIDDLRHSLDAATAGIHAPAGLAARARHAGQRRRTTQIAAAGVPGMAVAAAVAIAVSGSGPAAHHLAATPVANGAEAAHSTAPGIETAAYVSRRTQATLAGDGEDIIVQDMVTPQIKGYRVDASLDPVTGDARYDVYSNGTIFTREQSVRSLAADGDFQWTDTTVEPSNLTWWTTTVGASGPPEEGTAAPSGQNPASFAAQLRTELADHQVSEIGTGTIDGRHAVDLHVSTAGGVSTDVWVDATTYQPLQTVTLRGTTVGRTDDLTFEPRTVANLAELDVTIPAGYHEVAAP